MRPHTGRGRVQPQKGELGQPPITCLSRQGRVRLHANRLIFYFGLACKSSRAKPHCNTRSHKLHGLTSLARNKHTQNHHETPPAFSSAWAFRVYLPEHFFHFSHRLTDISVDCMFTSQSADNTSANPLVKCFYSFEGDCSNSLGSCHSSHPRYVRMPMHQHRELSLNPSLKGG